MLKMNHILKKLIKTKNKIQDYFEKNITGYTYLFFAQTAVVAENLFWHFELQSSFGKTSSHTIIGILSIYEIIFIYSLPLIFIIGAFTTFKYPKSKDWKWLFFIINLLLCTIILTAALLSYKI